MNTLTPYLEVKDLLVKRGGVQVLDIRSLTLQRDEVLSLIGPNGAGKSSLLLALACLLKTERGSILFDGRDIASGNGTFDYRRNIAMVFQEPLLFDTSVFRNVAAGLEIRHHKGSDIREAVMKALERFGIAHLAKRDARKLSGGEAQRTSLARAFATQPEIVFLDEPFSSLDPPTKESLMDDLQQVLKETKTTTVMATHDRLEALRLSSCLAVMKDGRIIQIGSGDMVMNHPVDEFVASFVGMETILSGEVVRKDAGTIVISVDGHEIQAVGSLGIGAKVLCCIRPEQVTLSALQDSTASSARNTMAARIVKIAPLGLFYKVVLDCGFPLTAYITGPSLEILSLREGVSVHASFKATAVHIIRK